MNTLRKYASLGTHIGNCYLPPGEKGGLLDWQLMVRGYWAQDITYLMVTG